MYSKTGYKRNSKDKKKPFNVIPSGRITMKDVDIPLFAIDNLGNQRVMYPNEEHQFPGSEVFEMPIFQAGGQNKPIFTNDKNSKQLKNYQDSAILYNDFIRQRDILDENILPNHPTTYSKPFSINKGENKYKNKNIKPIATIVYPSNPNKLVQNYAKPVQPVIYKAPPTVQEEPVVHPDYKPRYKDLGSKGYFKNNELIGVPIELPDGQVQMQLNGKLLGNPISRASFNENGGIDRDNPQLEKMMQLKKGGQLKKAQLGMTQIPGMEFIPNGEFKSAFQQTQNVNPLPLEKGVNTTAASQEGERISTLPNTPVPNYQPRERANLSYIPQWANAIAAGLGQAKANSRETAYQQSNLVDPLSVIPFIKSRGTTLDIAQQGGEAFADDEEDEWDEEPTEFNSMLSEDAEPELPEQEPAIEEIGQEDESSLEEIFGGYSDSDLDELDNLFGETQTSTLPSTPQIETIPDDFSQVMGKAPSDKSKYAFEYYKNKGLAPHIAAGIVGNLMAESNLNTTVSEVGGTGNGRGIAQWDVRNRWQNVKKFAQSQGRDYNDLDTQLDFVLEEANQRGDLQKVSQAKNSAEAAYLFAKHYERPKVIEPRRAAYANSLY